MSNGKRHLISIALGFSLAVAALLLLLGQVQLGTIALLLSGFAVAPVLKGMSRHLVSIALAFGLAVALSRLFLGHTQLGTIALLLSGFIVVSVVQGYRNKSKLHG